MRHAIRLMVLSLVASLTACGSSGDGAAGEATLTVSVSPPALTVLESSAEAFRATCRVPGVAACPVQADGRTWSRLTIPDGANPSWIGQPHLPSIPIVIALPTLVDGGVLPMPTVTVTAAQTRTFEGVNVLPVQTERVDRAIADVLAWPVPPFEQDAVVYGSNALFPATTHRLERIKADGLDLLVVHVYPACCRPVTGTVEVYGRLEIEVVMAPVGVPVAAPALTREVDARNSAPRERAHPVLALLANPELVQTLDLPTVPPPAVDLADADRLSEFLILTAPAYVPEAHRLAEHKRLQGGYVSRVRVDRTDAVTVGTSPPSAVAVRDWVRQVREGCGRIAFEWDADDDAADPSSEVLYLQVYGHWTDAQMFGFVLGTATTPVVPVDIYLDTEAGQFAEYRVHAEPPFTTYEFQRRGPTGFYDEVVLSGVASTASGMLCFEVPQTTLAVSGLRCWAEVGPEGSPSDRVPNAGGIQARLVDLEPTLRYLLLFGDVLDIPAEYDLCFFESNIPPGTGPDDPAEMLKVATDLYYGDLDGDRASELVVGRFCVKELEQATRCVNKVISYETSDPYVALEPRVLLTGDFEDRFAEGAVEGDGQEDAPFLYTLEKVRGYLRQRGVAVRSLYTARHFTPPPARLWDGTALDAAAAPTQALQGTVGQAVLNEFSAYQTTFVLHRDHAGIEGWAHPWFTTGELSEVLPPPVPFAGIYPVVFSLNCASGYFDVETDFFVDAYGQRRDNDEDWSQADRLVFAEQLVNQEQGAVAVLAATRVSDSAYNMVLADGLFRALYPDYPEHNGAPVLPRNGLGDVFEFARTYLATRTDPGRHRMASELFHIFGDPTLLLHVSR